MLFVEPIWLSIVIPILLALALLAMLAGVPWPGLSNGRPLFRF